MPHILKRLTISILVFSFSLVYGGDNELYIPLNIKKAYHNNTRSMDGKPGVNYWQNTADYTIDVRVYPHSRMLKGTQKITYYNNSPDTLKSIFIKLSPNLYKHGAMRDFSVSKEALHDGVRISNLVVAEQFIDLELEDSAGKISGTILSIKLDEVLTPESSTDITMDWEYIIPNISQVRTGAYDAHTFFVAYWYPQVAVYDDVDGWDMWNYTGITEQYNDFNNYDVKISLPSGYAMWGTGILQNPEELLPEPQLSLFEKAKRSDEIVRIMDMESYLADSTLINPKQNKWHFEAKHVPDFAFAFSNYFLWDATSIDLGADRERVLIQAAYRPESNDFFEVAEIAKNIIHGLSTDFPAVPYPYPAMTVFNGRGGMEYPMIINDGSTTSYERTVGLTAHEIAHTYFPFYMGINEKKYAWMDEGWAVALPIDVQKKLVPGSQPLVRRLAGYFRVSGNEMELPPFIPSVNLRRSSYRNASYNRPGLAYILLREMMGDLAFKKSLHSFVQDWNGKHPLPYDFFLSFNDTAAENLNWFFKPWFFEMGHADLAIENVKAERDKFIITIQKIGNLPVPVSLKITYMDDSTEEFFETAKIWRDGNSSAQITVDKKENKLKSIKLGRYYIPDVDKTNNTYNFKN